ncbi:MAG: hypothetical protein RMX68_008605 [Aulosira sp. ZfuVER01]|nr:hypothetical protein [Aulosira sp. ZfuVER01]MDZ7997425.1 hypothetical protein [Aulosira sp. DedVER01a]MDZ8054546.1 hypothetical protein [Aulosira sp. ZfuCHP01]
MNQANSLWQWVQPLSATLAGGKAPVYWQRDLQLTYERLDILWQQSAWVAQIAPIRLNLSDQPLLGHSLIALTEVGTRPSQAESESSLPQRSRLTWENLRSEKVDLITQPVRTNKIRAVPIPNNPSNRTISQFPDSDSLTTARLPPDVPQTSSQHSVTMVLQQSPQVSQQLLYRLASETDANSWQPTWKEVRSQYQNQLTTAQPKSSQQQTTPFNGGSINRNLSPIFNSNSINRANLSWTQSQPQAWQLRLVERAIASLNREKFAPATGNRLVKPERPAITLSLTQQWSTPLNGKTVNRETLKRLANPSVPENNSSTSNATKEKEVSQTTPNNHALDLLGKANLEKKQHSQDIETAHNQVASATLMPPPIVKSLLPPLLPLQMTNNAVPSVATAIIQQNAKQEETTTSEEDLNALATKIKRILDEEARRYGIDV